MIQFLIFKLALLLVVALSQLPQNASAEPKRGGTLRFGIGDDLVLMNPLVNTKATDYLIRELMFEPLLTVDEKGEIRPKLAAAWEISPDGKVYTFTLQKGVKFHNGRDLTAEDVKFSIEYSKNPKNAATGLSTLLIVDRVEALNPHVLKVVLKKRSAAFLGNLTDIASFSVVPQGSLKEGVAKPASFPPGTGPFNFIEWRPGQQIVLRKFDDYWGQKPLIDNLVLRPISNDTVRFTALRTGEVDIIERTPPEWAKQVVEGKVNGIKYSEARYLFPRRMAFNVADPPFNNKKLRRAVAHAIDKREFLSAVYHGLGEPMDQKYPKTLSWYIEGVPTPKYDPEKAKALLKEAGYNGEPIILNIGATRINEIQATVVQAQLKRVGINLKIRALEDGAYKLASRQGDFHFRFGGLSVNVNPEQVYAHGLRCERDLKKRGANFSGYCNKEMEALLDRAEVELDPQKRRALWKQIITKWAEDLPEMTLVSVRRFYSMRDYVKEFVADDLGSLVGYQKGLNYTWVNK